MASTYETPIAQGENLVETYRNHLHKLVDLYDRRMYWDCYVYANTILNAIHVMVAMGRIKEDRALVENAERLRDLCRSLIADLLPKLGNLETAADGSGASESDAAAMQAACASLVEFGDGSASGRENCSRYWFDRLSGLKDAKLKLKNGFIYPLVYPNLFGKMSRAMLLWGPPGTGKTELIKAAVNELQVVDPCIQVLFFSPQTADLKGKYVGESEQKIRNLFKGASLLAVRKGRGSSGGSSSKLTTAVLFLDEIDGIAGSGRDTGDAMGMIMATTVNALLQLIGGVGEVENVVVVGATNYPWIIDPAVLRRFSYKIYVRLPEQDDVAEMIDAKLSAIYSSYVTAERHTSKFNIARSEGDGGAAAIGRPSSRTCDEKLDGLRPCDQRPLAQSWRRLPVIKRMPEVISPKEVRAIAATLCSPRYVEKAGHFSGSDITRLVDVTVKKMAEDALAEGRFVKLIDVCEDFEGKVTQILRKTYKDTSGQTTPAGYMRETDQSTVMNVMRGFKAMVDRCGGLCGVWAEGFYNAMTKTTPALGEAMFIRYAPISAIMHPLNTSEDMHTDARLDIRYGIETNANFSDIQQRVTSEIDNPVTPGYEKVKSMIDAVVRNDPSDVQTAIRLFYKYYLVLMLYEPEYSRGNDPANRIPYPYVRAQRDTYTALVDPTVKLEYNCVKYISEPDYNSPNAVTIAGATYLNALQRRDMYIPHKKFGFDEMYVSDASKVQDLQYICEFRANLVQGSPAPKQSGGNIELSFLQKLKAHYLIRGIGVADTIAFDHVLGVGESGLTTTQRNVVDDKIMSSNSSEYIIDRLEAMQKSDGILQTGAANVHLREGDFAQVRLYVKISGDTLQRRALTYRESLFGTYDTFSSEHVRQRQQAGLQEKEAQLSTVEVPYFYNLFNTRLFSAMFEGQTEMYAGYLGKFYRVTIRSGDINREYLGKSIRIEGQNVLTPEALQVFLSELLTGSRDKVRIAEITDFSVSYTKAKRPPAPTVQAVGGCSDRIEENVRFVSYGITAEHFRAALDEVRPTVSHEQFNQYEEYERTGRTPEKK